ncbi:hypothetical protein ONS95_009139 [Cadophora gregata]|uniref:uncharacterized protein n=1 Tax=Cadophora gregata TaxID=51156 RepID=UPI0026DC9DD1|nr:uncharacterized protein ONS95_009139 [Cadophora gregata]KAK0124156.1 hypothetical protein ONS95_009139 [Cadophora gregata]KAK0130485.1 hypothetical protein ONS96_001004 [Cadophora gregata f. sp. sojae]
MAGKTVFLIGPGFIGLEVLAELLKEGYQVTTLVRREEAAADLKTKGVNTIMGTLSDLDLITSTSADSDIVIHTATADDKPSAEAVLDGITKRAATGKSTIYIHTSGCSEIVDDSHGAYVSDKIYEDDKPETIDALPDTAHHRSIDLVILKRRKELGTQAKISIILPPLIYGVGKASGRLSIQIPAMAKFALKHGYAGYVGAGESVWGHVHVSDLARGYLLILHWMEQASPEKVLGNPYFFAENGEEHSWKKCAEEIGKALYNGGKIKDPKPREIPESLYGDIFGEMSLTVVGENSRNRANRLRALGWKPVEKSSFQSLREDEIPALLKQEGK